MSKPIIPISQSIYDAKGDQLTYSTWLKINRALASASGAGGSTDLGPISGLLASTSGYLDSKIVSTSGYLQTQISNVSGTLHNEIVSVSGFLITNINTYSGYVEATYAKKGFYNKHNVPLSSGYYFNNNYEMLSGTISNGLVLPASGKIEETSLTVNGLTYFLDSWIDTASGVHNITNVSGGFSVDYSRDFNTIYLKWNYIPDQGGFWLIDEDTILLEFYTE
jgi:hypothetical protein